MDREAVAANLAKVESLFDKGSYEKAIDLLQQCIDASRLESKEFMERLRNSTRNPEKLDKLVYMYFLNFV